MIKAKVLFLCSGNSARSQMCEAFCRKYAGHEFEVFSAGIEPKGLNSFTIRVMKEIGFDMSDHRSKSTCEYLGWINFSYLVTVCDEAEAQCPVAFLGISQRLFWPFEDPAKVEGSEEEKLAKFREVGDQIDAKIKAWLIEINVPIAGAILLKQHRPKLLAEAIGTFALVFTGCGAIITDSVSGGRLTHLGAALTFGLTITVMIASLGHISGAHFNPAVMIALASRRYFPASMILPHLIAQLLGAWLAASVLSALFGPIADLGATAPAGSPWPSFVLEIFLTAILVFIIACVALDSKVAPGLPPLAIGGTVALEALFAGPVSGASMNPACSLAPALLSGQLANLWIYLTAPVFGRLLGIFLFQATRQESTS